MGGLVSNVAAGIITAVLIWCWVKWGLPRAKPKWESFQERRVAKRIDNDELFRVMVMAYAQNPAMWTAFVGRQLAALIVNGTFVIWGIASVLLGFELRDSDDEALAALSSFLTAVGMLSAGLSVTFLFLGVKRINSYSRAVATHTLDSLVERYGSSAPATDPPEEQ